MPGERGRRPDKGRRKDGKMLVVGLLFTEGVAEGFAKLVAQVGHDQQRASKIVRQGDAKRL